jgi:S1-C subfamily serine protease
MKRPDFRGLASFVLLVCQTLSPAPQDAVVGIRATVPEDAYTAPFLGSRREGTGVLIDPQGHVLTIGYLVVEAEAIEVIGPGGESSPASFVGYDFETGFALIRAELPVGAQAIRLGESSAVAQGDRLTVAGHGSPPQPARLLLRGEFTGDWEYMLEDALYAAPPHPGFGGAALITAEGDLVGIGSIFTRLYAPGYGAVPCNMFVPVDLLKPILSDLVAWGRPRKPPRPWLGLAAAEASGRVIVNRVSPSGPAEEAGLEPGDVILAVDGQAVSSLGDLYRRVWALGEAGVRVPLTVLQGTQVRAVGLESVDRYRFLKVTRGPAARVVLAPAGRGRHGAATDDAWGQD